MWRWYVPSCCLLSLVWVGAFAAGRTCISGLCLIGLVASAGGVWHHLRWRTVAQDDLVRWASTEAQAIQLRARLRDAPRTFAADDDVMSTLPASPTTVCRIEALELRDGNAWQPVQGRGRMSIAGQVVGLNPGDTIEFYGQLQRPRGPSNPGELSREDLARYRRQRYRVRVNHPQGIVVLRQSSVIDPRFWLPRFRRASEHRLRQHLPEDVGDISSALLLGAQECIESHERDAFLATGTMHLLAISGLHVMILAGSVQTLLLLGGWSDRARIAVVLAVVVFYAALSGARAPVTRASILVVLWGLEWWLHRSRGSWNGLCAAGVGALCWDPTQLFQVGAQLSFLALAVIVTMLRFLERSESDDPLDRLLRQNRPAWRLCWDVCRQRTLETTRVSTLIWLAALPLVAFHFHVISLIAVAINLLLWIPIWLAMLSGFCLLILVWLAPLIAWPLAAAHGSCVQFVLTASTWAATWPGSHWWVAGPGGLGLVVFYTVLLVSALAAQRPWHWFAGALGGSLLLLCLWTVPIDADASHRRDRLDVWVLAVGHGSSVVVQLPDDRVLLYDAGSLSHPRQTADIVSRFLWFHRLRRIDILVISHADVDHFSAVPQLLQRFDVRRVCLTEGTWDQPSASVDFLRQALSERGVEVEWTAAGTVLWSQGESSISVLHPAAGRTYSTDNAASIVLSVRHADRSLLLTGDIEEDGLAELLSRPALDTDVALAPHHGSPQSAPHAFAEWSHPEWVLVSGGRPPDPHVVTQWTAAGSQLVHTESTGAIHVVVEPLGRIMVEGFREPAKPRRGP